MSARVRLLSWGAACASILWLVSACASGPTEIPPNLSAVEIFQRAQDAADHSDYTLAIRYYSTVATSHPDDINHVTWASYEIAFLYHKMGKDDIALERMNQLLETYSKDTGTLPPAPRILAQKLVKKLEEEKQKKAP